MSFLLGQYPVHLYLNRCSMSCVRDWEGAECARSRCRQVSKRASQLASGLVGTNWMPHRAATRLPKAVYVIHNCWAAFGSCIHAHGMRVQHCLKTIVYLDRRFDSTTRRDIDFTESCRVTMMHDTSTRSKLPRLDPDGIDRIDRDNKVLESVSIHITPPVLPHLPNDQRRHNHNPSSYDPKTRHLKSRCTASRLHLPAAMLFAGFIRKVSK